MIDGGHPLKFGVDAKPQLCGHPKQKGFGACPPKSGGLGELVRLVRSPVTGRSASFRLRFRFVRVVRAVRAGEAKLRGRMTSDVPIAGPPG